MTEQELNEIENTILEQFQNAEISDEAIISQIKSIPEAINQILQSGSHLFLWAVLWDRFAAAQLLAEMGADVHCRFEGSLIAGNALNVAHTPEQAEYLLGLGLEIEKNLKRSSGPYLNPAIVAAGHNDKIMTSYWLGRQREIFKDDEKYVSELMRETVCWISMLNQYDMLAHIIADKQLYNILKEYYANEDDKKSIKLSLSALRQIKDETLEPQKKELCRILNARRRELP